MNGTLTRAENAIWTKAWEKNLALGYDHGYAAYAADEAVERQRRANRKPVKARRPR